jgi:topoisomerase-4 subunit B
MAEDTRRLVQLVIDNEKALDESMDMLLAKKRSADRRAWIEKNGHAAEV